MAHAVEARPICMHEFLSNMASNSSTCVTRQYSIDTRESWEILSHTCGIRGIPWAIKYKSHLYWFANILTCGRAAIGPARTRPLWYGTNPSAILKRTCAQLRRLFHIHSNRRHSLVVLQVQRVEMLHPGDAGGESPFDFVVCHAQAA